jgi:hypothetical protein
MSTRLFMLAALHGAGEGRGYEIPRYVKEVGERDVLYRIWPVLAFEFTLYSSQEDTLGSFSQDSTTAAM